MRHQRRKACAKALQSGPVASLRSHSDAAIWSLYLSGPSPQGRGHGISPPKEGVSQKACASHENKSLQVRGPRATDGPTGPVHRRMLYNTLHEKWCCSTFREAETPLSHCCRSVVLIGGGVFLLTSWRDNEEPAPNIRHSYLNTCFSLSRAGQWCATLRWLHSSITFPKRLLEATRSKDGGASLAWNDLLAWRGSVGKASCFGGCLLCAPSRSLPPERGSKIASHSVWRVLDGRAPEVHQLINIVARTWPRRAAALEGRTTPRHARRAAIRGIPCSLSCLSYPIHCQGQAGREGEGEGGEEKMKPT